MPTTDAQDRVAQHLMAYYDRVEGSPVRDHPHAVLLTATNRETGRWPLRRERHVPMARWIVTNDGLIVSCWERPPADATVAWFEQRMR